MINIKTPFIIYCRAVGLYALLTVPALVVPIMYMMSLMYVLIFGWFAWALFTTLYIVTTRLLYDYVLRLLCLFLSVVGAVAFAFHMIGVLHAREDVWHSGFLVFPFAAVIVGWISLCLSGERIRSAGLDADYYNAVEIENLKA